MERPLAEALALDPRLGTDNTIYWDIYNRRKVLWASPDDRFFCITTEEHPFLWVWAMFGEGLFKWQKPMMEMLTTYMQIENLVAIRATVRPSLVSYLKSRHWVEAATVMEYQHERA